jgi:hypothetical protein
MKNDSLQVILPLKQSISGRNCLSRLTAFRYHCRNLSGLLSVLRKKLRDQKKDQDTYEDQR